MVHFFTSLLHLQTGAVVFFEAFYSCRIVFWGFLGKITKKGGKEGVFE